jgi:hypothetical protein
MSAKKQRVPSRRQIAELTRHVEAIADRGSTNPRSPDYDPIEASLARHPGLTRERAEQMAKAFGFL